MGKYIHSKMCISPWRHFFLLRNSKTLKFPYAGMQAVMCNCEWGVTRFYAYFKTCGNTRRKVYFYVSGNFWGMRKINEFSIPRIYTYLLVNLRLRKYTRVGERKEFFNRIWLKIDLFEEHEYINIFEIQFKNGAQISFVTLWNNANLYLLAWKWLGRYKASIYQEMRNQNLDSYKKRGEIFSRFDRRHEKRNVWSKWALLYAL